MVVVDSVTSGNQTGDGNPTGLGGSIWFQNFGQDGAIQGPALMCWDIQIGPFDCRTFLVGGTGDNGVVGTTSALYPNNAGDQRPAYQRLGRFLGLSQSGAGMD